MDELLKRLDRQNQREQRELSPEFLQTLAQELALTAETMNFELTDLAVAGYREALSDLRPDQLRRGFKRARRVLNFFPKPNEVRECAYLEFQDEQPIRQYLPEAEPVWSEEDRRKWTADIAAACGKKIFTPPTQEEWDARRELLKQQAAQLLAGQSSAASLEKK